VGRELSWEQLLYNFSFIWADTTDISQNINHMKEFLEKCHWKNGFLYQEWMSLSRRLDAKRTKTMTFVGLKCAIIRNVQINNNKALNAVKNRVAYPPVGSKYQEKQNLYLRLPINNYSRYVSCFVCDRRAIEKRCNWSYKRIDNRTEWKLQHSSRQLQYKLF
jgi:hypothetical protein